MDSAKTESYEAQDLAGKAILFEIGSKAGILDFIEKEQFITVSRLSKNLEIGIDFIKVYLDVMVSLNVLSKKRHEFSNEEVYSKSSIFQREKNKIGYISWGMISCAPLIQNTENFVKDFQNAIKLFHRDPEHVALTSKWMGEKDFYPYAEKEIIRLNPRRVVDLGSGTCGLLMRLAKQIEHMVGVGIDISQEACNQAREYIRQEGLDHRLNVINSPIQDLTNNKEIFEKVDIVHAGFVFHDLLPDEEEKLISLLSFIQQVAPEVTLIIVDAIPFCSVQYERSFSAAFSFLHRFYMGRLFPTENGWKEKLNLAGFNNVRIQPLGISGGRIFIAKKDYNQ